MASFLIIARELVVTGLRGVAASKLGKFKFVLQYTALCVLIFPATLIPIPHLHLLGLYILYVSVLLTIWSEIDYFYKFQKVFLVSPKPGQ